jgi:hypothetical protein
LCPKTTLGVLLTWHYPLLFRAQWKKEQSPKPSAARQGAVKAAVFPDNFQIKISLIEKPFLAVLTKGLIQFK